MPFDKQQAARLLASCHRRCCVCHRFCGVKIELHHIEHKANGGSDDINNAIPLCFECHAEVNHYSDSHPRGRKITDVELHIHKEQWVEICKSNPHALITAPRDIDVGPLEGMLLETEHNLVVIERITEGPSWQSEIGCVLNDNEFKRAIEQGSLLVIPIELRKQLSNAYAAVGRINTFVHLYSNTRPEGEAFAQATNKLLEAYRHSKEPITVALTGLKDYLTFDKEGQ